MEYSLLASEQLNEDILGFLALYSLNVPFDSLIVELVSPLLVDQLSLILRLNQSLISLVDLGEHLVEDMWFALLTLFHGVDFDEALQMYLTAIVFHSSVALLHLLLLVVRQLFHHVDHELLEVLR